MKRLTIIFIIFLTLNGCSQSPIRNPFAGRQEPTLGELPSVKSPALVGIKWTTPALSKQERFTKLIPYVDKLIYAADPQGKIVALDQNHGKKIWQIDLHRKLSSGPTFINDTLLLTTMDAKVIAIQVPEGKLLWETKVSSQVLAPPLAVSNLVVVHAMDGSVIALNQKNGEIVWQVEQSIPSLTLHFSSKPALKDEKILIGFANGKLLALNTSGLIEWERAIALAHGRSEIQRMVDISADPVIIGDMVYVINYQGKLAGVNIDSGELVWEREISSYQNIAYDKDTLYITDNQHGLWAIDRYHGTTLWKQTELASRYITGPTVFKNWVVVADRGGYVHFISAKNGHLMDSLAVSGKIYQNPQALKKEILVSRSDGKIIAIHLKRDN